MKIQDKQVDNILCEGCVLGKQQKILIRQYMKMTEIPHPVRIFILIYVDPLVLYP